MRSGLLNGGCAVLDSPDPERETGVMRSVSRFRPLAVAAVGVVLAVGVAAGPGVASAAGNGGDDRGRGDVVAYRQCVRAAMAVGVTPPGPGGFSALSAEDRAAVRAVRLVARDSCASSAPARLRQKIARRAQGREGRRTP